VPPHPIPQPRVDSFVSDPQTGQKRRQTEYSGTLWYGSPPDTSGGMVAFHASGLREDSVLFLPDSLPYRRSELDDAVVACTVGIQGQMAKTTFVTSAHASFGEDPRDGETAWIQLQLSVYGHEPLAVAYRVVATCRSTAAPSPQVVDLRGR
jgi:hypothetical protein